MYKSATVRVLAATLASALSLFAQTATKTGPWRRIGNALIDRSLAGLASGPVDRVWYSSDGSQLLLRTPSGKIFATTDFETWQPAYGVPPANPSAPTTGRLPEPQAQTRSARAGSPRL